MQQTMQSTEKPQIAATVEMPKNTRQTTRATVLKRMRENWMFYVSIAPFFVLFALFGAYPIIASFYYGFTRWDGLSQPEFIGFGNYRALFSNPDFPKILYNTFYIWFFSTLITLALAFLLAFLVNHYVRVARTFFRIVFLFPLLVAPALTAIIISVIFSTEAGLVNTVWSFLAGHKVEYDWFSSGIWIKPMIILMVVWRWTGWHFILFLSGLQTIPSEVYESACIDGAKGRQIFRYVTFPMMRPMILVSAVIATIGGLQIFDEPYVLTGGTGGTLQAGTTLGLYQYQTAFQQFNFGLASATSYVIFAIILVFSLINFRLLRRRS
jgi:ABC-type sugar transport system permease subunit